jgi:hypothetical protein
MSGTAWFDMEGNPTRIPVPAVTADARTVTDLETTALEKLDRLLAQDRFELPHVEVGRAAVRELARRLEDEYRRGYDEGYATATEAYTERSDGRRRYVTAVLLFARARVRFPSRMGPGWHQ